MEDSSENKELETSTTNANATGAEEVETPKDEKDELIASLKKSLYNERKEKKQWEKIAKSKEYHDEELKREEQGIREKLKKSKSEFSDDTIDDLMEIFGKEQARNNIDRKERKVESEILELQRNPMYIDVDDYVDEMRPLMKKGLTAEQAYWAINGKNKLDSEVSKKTTQKEKEDKQKETKERANEAFVNDIPAGKSKQESYTEKERRIAKVNNISLEEARARSSAFTLDAILEANKKFKGGN